MELADLLDAISPKRTEAGVFEATPYDRGAGVVDAGALTALVTAVGAADGAPVRSVHATFFRAADPTRPVTLRAQDLHRGRTLGARSVDAEQGGRGVASAHVTLGPLSKSLLEHASVPRPLPEPPTAAAQRAPHPGFTAVVGDVDPFDGDRTWDPTWQVWADCDGVSRANGTIESYIAFHTNEYLVSAAVLPHAGFGMGDAHRGVLTVITASDVVFHNVHAVQRWLLFDQTSTYAGGGWVYGRGAAYTPEGTLVASYSQQAILRAMGSPLLEIGSADATRPV